MNKFYLS